jgi:diguanylate cyclase (GGDEF)-like protein
VSTDEAISTALDDLRGLISARVHAEQRTTHLTGLPNQTALDEAIAEALAPGGPKFWLAFIEVDKFKGINDRFSYQNADILLGQIARILGTMCTSFVGRTIAYHAHGDEFYLMGDDSADAAAIATSLEVIRTAIASTKIVVDKIGTMACTVSIGWLAQADVQTGSLRTVLTAVEKAVAVAKREGRDRVVRYSREVSEHDWITMRADCGTCGTKFEMMLRRADNKPDEHLSCPNPSLPT